ncbi:MAG TPA: hypothetical protein VG890_02950 [Puia sp.]|nr:hypothetical protein [Puia sp.]
MSPLIRTLLALPFLSLSFAACFAGTGTVKPVQNTSRTFISQVRTLDSALSTSLAVLTDDRTAENSDAATAHSGRICSCQILNLQSSNYDHRHVALFAEKTNHGSSADYAVAKKRLDREKKNLRRQFYDKVEVVSEISGVGSCQSLYVRLKGSDEHLQMYEVLNAD